MRKINLNHALHLPNRIRPAHAILGTGLVAAVLLMLAWSQVGARQAALDAALERLRNPAPKSTSHSATRDTQHAELAAAQAAMGELEIAWEPLLQGLEAIEMGDIKLLAIEPAPRLHKLRITAETGTPAEMLDYVQALAQLPMLRNVVLQRQEKGGDGRQIFSVEAVWSAQREN